MHHQCVDVCTKGIWETSYAEEGDWLVDTEGMEVVSGEEDCQIECGKMEGQMFIRQGKIVVNDETKDKGMLTIRKFFS